MTYIPTSINTKNYANKLHINTNVIFKENSNRSPHLFVGDIKIYTGKLFGCYFLKSVYFAILQHMETVSLVGDFLRL